MYLSLFMITIKTNECIFIRLSSLLLKTNDTFVWGFLFFFFFVGGA